MSQGSANECMACDGYVDGEVAKGGYLYCDDCDPACERDHALATLRLIRALTRGSGDAALVCHEVQSAIRERHPEMKESDDD